MLHEGLQELKDFYMIRCTAQFKVYTKCSRRWKEEIDLMPHGVDVPSYGRWWVVTTAGDIHSQLHDLSADLRTGAPASETAGLKEEIAHRVGRQSSRWVLSDPCRGACHTQPKDMHFGYWCSRPRMPSLGHSQKSKSSSAFSVRQLGKKVAAWMSVKTR